MIAIENSECIDYVPITRSAETKTSSCELHVFDVSLYENLFNQTTQVGLSREEARSVVASAAAYDSLGAITENISGEKNDFGGYIFDVENRIRMQLTPPRHLYLQEEDEITHELMMVAPEHKWGSFKKDVLSLVSDWRRGMDKVGMAGVRARFLDKSEDALREGETIIWGSPKAEQWEGDTVMKYNGQYGFLYVGKVVDIDGARALEVHDFKNDLDADAYDSFFRSLEGEVRTNPLYVDRPLVDKVKASYVRTGQHLTAGEVWKKLGEAQSQATGKGEIFDLPIDAIISLQDPELHKRISSEIAAPIGAWIAVEVYKGTPNDEIQCQVRQKFIDATLVLISRIKAEKAIRMRPTGERSLMDVNALPTPDSQRYANPPDPVILQRYSGSGGAGCGSWGRSGSGRSGIRSGASSVAGLSSAFGGAEHKWFVCPRCGYEADGPVGDSCPQNKGGCGLTKEEYAQVGGQTC